VRSDVTLCLGRPQVSLDMLGMVTLSVLDGLLITMKLKISHQGSGPLCKLAHGAKELSNIVRIRHQLASTSSYCCRALQLAIGLRLSLSFEGLATHLGHKHLVAEKLLDVRFLILQDVALAISAGVVHSDVD